MTNINKTNNQKSKVSMIFRLTALLINVVYILFSYMLYKDPLNIVKNTWVVYTLIVYAVFLGVRVIYAFKKDDITCLKIDITDFIFLAFAIIYFLNDYIYDVAVGAIVLKLGDILAYYSKKADQKRSAELKKELLKMEKRRNMRKNRRARTIYKDI